MIFFKMEVLEVALDQCGIGSSRRLAFVDKNRDLYLLNVRAVQSSSKKMTKLGEFCWKFVACLLNVL